MYGHRRKNMKLNADYKKVRDKSTNGFITKELFPYLFQYYRDHANIPALNNYNVFSLHFTLYLNMPIVYPNGNIVQPVEELKGQLNKIFTHLDKKYQEEDNNEETK